MKKFFDVFPFLQVDDKVRQFLEETEVERVSSTKKKDLLRIYMVSGRLIEKEYIWKAEKGIEKMLSSFQTKVKIYEKYHLSSQYNTEKLMNAYRNSILLELREYSPVEYNLFKNGDISYPEEDRIVLSWDAFWKKYVTKGADFRQALKLPIKKKGQRRTEKRMS